MSDARGPGAGRKAGGRSGRAAGAALPPVLIVDGYNVIGASEEYRALMESEPAVARMRLVDAIASSAGSAVDTVVVFDGAANPTSDGTPVDEGGVTVIFSPAGMSADSVVEALSRGLRDAGRQVRVVTSDSETRHAVFGPLVQVTSAAVFLEELASWADEGSAQASRGPRRARLEDALSPSVRAILLRMRDGSA